MKTVKPDPDPTADPASDPTSPDPSASTALPTDPEPAFDRWRRVAGAVLAPVAFITTYLATDALTPQGRRLSSILAGVAVLWITETLPLPVTALLGAVLCVLLGVAPVRDVLGYFADPIVFLFIGSFMLARAMMIHRLDRRIALSFLSIRWIARSPARVLAGLGIVTALLSMWVSNTATTAMMLPIALGILGAMAPGRASGTSINPRNWPFATGMMLMVAYAASIGGIGTPIGSPPNLIAKGFIQRATGQDISFLRWMVLCAPMLIVMGAVLFVLLRKLHPQQSIRSNSKPSDLDPSSDPESLSDYIRREKSALGQWTTGQINTLVAFGVAVALWVMPGLLKLPLWGPLESTASVVADWFNAHLPESIVALIAAILLFLLPVNLRPARFTLTWDHAIRIDWGTILLFGGGLALGGLMDKTGVADALGRAVTSHVGVSTVWTLTAASIALGILLSEAASNTAAANMIVPVVIGIAQSAGVSPIPPALGACLGASYGFMLPVSTPPNAIVYGSGLVSIPSMMRAGILFDLVGFIIIWCGLRAMCPVLGLM